LFEKCSIFASTFASNHKLKESQAGKDLDWFYTFTYTVLIILETATTWQQVELC